MNCNGIAIVGANGSGKTTLGKHLSDLLSYRHMDVEDYYFPHTRWDESGNPYINPRTKIQTLYIIIRRR